MIKYVCPNCKTSTKLATVNVTFDLSPGTMNAFTVYIVQALYRASQFDLNGTKILLASISFPCQNCSVKTLFWDGLSGTQHEFDGFKRRYVYNQTFQAGGSTAQATSSSGSNVIDTLADIKAKPRHQRTQDDWKKLAGEM